MSSSIHRVRSPHSGAWAFDNSYARLPERFYSRVQPEPASNPSLIRVNRGLAERLGLDPDWLESAEGVAVVAGNAVPSGADPMALAYAGHQFGGWNPQLGDGRALLLGEVVAPDGTRFDIQLKGSGKTPYSRRGDGKAPLGPVLREFMISEAMATLGVPTCRTLAAVTTGDRVLRMRALPGAVLARVAQSHIRIGTFEYFEFRDDREALELLTEYALRRHDPEAEADIPALALLEGVLERQASLVAQWQLLGFIHGVMNTDNVLISGETIDYGPCAFMDRFNTGTVFSSIDHQGRYAYGNQPAITHWNLSRLAQALLPLLAETESEAIQRAQDVLGRFSDRFGQALESGIRLKLGLYETREDDMPLMQEFFSLMQEHGVDFTLAFRRLTERSEPDHFEHTVEECFVFPDAFSSWLTRWEDRTAQESIPSSERARRMARVNPAIIARNHKVEEAIAAAVDEQDFGPFHRMMEVLADPWTYRPELRDHARPPRPEEEVHQTFCGT